MTPRARLHATVARAALMAGISSILPLFAAGPAWAQPAEPTRLAPVEVTAEQELLQAPGVSVITREQIQRMPPANDINEIVRRMPGVNLTGNSASGQYGNNRQIDLRGMGPENTLILIDGRPVRSRDAVRMGRSGERNTRGDSNWVPADAIERIEVIRGPAAARYGSGAAGGVINIITKAPADRTSGSFSVYGQQPQDGNEGNTGRATATLAGPIAQGWSYSLYGNFNRTDADDLALNAGAPNLDPGYVPPAGREGVVNRDFSGTVRWVPVEGQVFEAGLGYSRQRNIYAGDRAVSSAGSVVIEELANAGNTTNIMTRRTAFLAHRGTWGFGTSRLGFQYEDTDNERLREGLAGSVEGSISNPQNWSTSTLRNYTANGEVNVPFTLVFPHTVTVGAEYWRQTLDDPYSMTQGATSGGGIPSLPAGQRDSGSSADVYAFFLEDNIGIGDRLTLTPGIRFDHHSEFGWNVSPALSASLELGSGFTLKGGIARAFKAPNLYQSNPNYLYYTMGNGCPVDFPSLGAGCYVMGNDDLEPETSWNSEVGLLYSMDGWTASITYFHNKYDNKIVAGDVPVGTTVGGNGRIFQWQNAKNATVEGIEGSLLVPLAPTVSWTTNFTYMISNHDQNDQPLSVIPEYTINTWLDWQATERFSVMLGVTYYGEQEPRSVTSTGANATGDALRTRDPYAIVNISGSFDINPHARLTAGVMNVFDEQLKREANSGGAGANSYNEPGRAYFVSLTATF